MVRAMRILSFSFLLGVFGCSPGGRDNTQTDSGTGNRDTGGNVDMSRVYAHSGTRLYRVDTQTLMPVEIGQFTGIGTQSLTDLASKPGSVKAARTAVQDRLRVIAHALIGPL